MLVWNGLTTWWIWNASEIGAVSAFLVNGMLMCVPWMIYHIVLKKSGTGPALIVWLLLWMSFEYFHLQDWGMSWPWLTLGNVFASRPEWVQWYSITGSSGGTLWVLLVNLLCIQLLISGKKSKNLSGLTAITILFPLLLSIAITPEINTPSANAKNVVVVQPNVDPYSEKFAIGSQDVQIQRLVRMSESLIDSNTALVVWPETAVPVQAWEESLAGNFFYEPIWALAKRHPSIAICTGIDSYRRVPDGQKPPFGARKFEDGPGYYEAFNTAAFIRSGKNDSLPEFQLYHKSRLVPGVEALPSFLSFLGPLVDSFGGISGTYGKQKERTVFSFPENPFRVAPAICYESIYGEFLSEYTRNGANLIAIVTNDGWWGDTPGYLHHMQYARLRAIENRRWVVRSANTGISCFIDPAGNIYQPQPWDKQTVIKQTIEPETTMTFFVKSGDLLSKAAIALLVMYLLFLFVPFRKK